MTLDLNLLLWTVALALVQIVIAVLLTSGQVSLGAVAGNREGMAEPAGAAGRAQRAYRNLLESLVLFVALVMMAHLARRTNGITLLGEEVFFIARLAYAGIYIAGLPWLRTAAWLVSVIGLLLIFSQLL